MPRLALYSAGLLERHESALVLLPKGHALMRSVTMIFDAYLGAEQKGILSRTECPQVAPAPGQSFSARLAMAVIS